ncbi:MAG: hypothetical protein ACJARD_000002 [Alphaproteobacteria bacterium]|jgi:hypothetical protein
MNIRLISYISSGFVIVFAIITIAYEFGRQKDLDHNIKMYPYMSDISHKIDKIDIRFPDRVLTMIRKDDNWTLKTSDNFPAEVKMIEALYKHISSIELLANKTQNNKNFAHLNLLNPNYSKQIEGEGTRITLSINGETPMIDFIAGVALESYRNLNNTRLFVRYGANGGAFLAQAASNFQYKPASFFTSKFGMPQIDEILSAKLIVQNRSILTMKRTTDPTNEGKINFLPPEIPKDKKLIYPLILRDYLMALTQKLRPVDAMALPPEKVLSDVSMVFELTNSRLAKINFWRSDDNHYIRIIRDDLQTPHNFYIYRISKNDYETFVQPLDKFLKASL